jgi:hypothetical protein
MKRLFQRKGGEENPSPHCRPHTNTFETTNSSTVIEPPAQPIETSPSTSSRVDKYGLFLLTPQASQTEVLEAEEAFLLDIVAVHGIAGDAYDTWTHANGKFWLRDFVPEEFPGARVFSFGYDAEVFFSRSEGNIESYARSLLDGLTRERMEEKVIEFSI